MCSSRRPSRVLCPSFTALRPMHLRSGTRRSAAPRSAREARARALGAHAADRGEPACPVTVDTMPSVLTRCLARCLPRTRPACRVRPTSSRPRRVRLVPAACPPRAPRTRRRWRGPGRPRLVAGAQQPRLAHAERAHEHDAHACRAHASEHEPAAAPTRRRRGHGRSVQTARFPRLH